MTRSAGFFKAFFGACCGRDIFYTLRNHSWGRTLWHLFLLSFITGLLIGQVSFERKKEQIESLQAVFTERFGQQVCINKDLMSWNWICPAKDPLKAREMALPENGRLYYTGNQRKVPDSLKNVTGTVVVWSPLALAVSVPGPRGSANCMVVDTLSGRARRFDGSPASMEEFFKKAPEKLPFDMKQLQKEDVEDVFSAVFFFFSFLGTAGIVIWNFFLVLLYTGIFMGMYRLLNGPGGRLRFLTMSGMWKCGIYAAMPAMAVASLFPLLELPLISYETVFMIGLLIYWMAVAAKLERTPKDDEVNNAKHEQ
ncbi:MAG: hypothetical protein IJV93_05520 [Lentisphaeria bacterium]|nr:hypothetical protein [Lentisphaeria bacterium]